MHTTWVLVAIAGLAASLSCGRKRAPAEADVPAQVSTPVSAMTQPVTNGADGPSDSRNDSPNDNRNDGPNDSAGTDATGGTGAPVARRDDSGNLGIMLTAAARALLEALDASDRGRVVLAFDSEARERWHYTPQRRQGLAIGDLAEAERAALHALLRAALGERGHAKVEGILRIEPILGQIEGNADFRDPGRYHVLLFGEPADAAPWGWRFEGHHLSLSFTQVGQEVASTPAFFGANPARVPSGPDRGLRVLAEEEDTGRALFAMLTAAQQERARIAGRAPDDIVTGNDRRARLARFEGLPAADMTPAQRDQLLRLIAVYTGNLHPDLARAHLARIEGAGIERVCFAWAGSVEPGRGHYYRIHGPTHLIEYDNRGGNHIHTVFRDLENDFGEDLLARHLREGHDRPARAGDEH